MNRVMPFLRVEYNPWPPGEGSLGHDDDLWDGLRVRMNMTSSHIFRPPGRADTKLIVVHIEEVYNYFLHAKARSVQLHLDIFFPCNACVRLHISPYARASNPVLYSRQLGKGGKAETSLEICQDEARKQDRTKRFEEKWLKFVRLDLCYFPI